MSDATCLGCNQARGYIYTGLPCADEELQDANCPWCIADGTAATRFGAEFIDKDGIGDHGSWDAVPDAVIEVVAMRTPGFTGWHEERWWTHCGDAAEYLVRAGHFD